MKNKISEVSYRYNNQAFLSQKRGFDLVFSCLAILILFPIMTLLALITLLSSRGPALYRQERLGRNGKRFTMLKFRSMKTNAEHRGPALTVKNDPRVTPWGKVMRRYKLDEIPQFFNVLKGDMSVVGPRPERDFWKKEIEKGARSVRRLSVVKPGMTSLGQVMYGYAENVEEMKKRLRYDLLYLENMSISMDIKIIFLTVGLIFSGRKTDHKN